MNVSNYLHLVPEIEDWLAEKKLDAIVVGLGPTAWLLRYVRRSLLRDVRIFGVHNACEILPVDDLVIMDAPTQALHPIQVRHQKIVDSRPKRIWIMDWHHKAWLQFLHPSVHDVTTSVPWLVWGCHDQKVLAGESAPRLRKKALTLDSDPPHTALISPTGTTTLAWNLGCRRIGIIGVDLQADQHHMWSRRESIDRFFLIVANQAHERGGLIANLSPITTCKRFKEWKPSTSGLAPTDGSSKPEQSESSSTASVSTPRVQWPSTGCGLASQDGK